MEQYFKSVLLLSIAGAALTVVLLLLKPLTKRFFGSRWQYYIWLSVLLIMVLPIRFSIPSEKKIFIPVQQNNNIQITQSEGNETVSEDIAANGTETAHDPASKGQNDTVRTNSFRKDFVEAIPYIWLLGAFIFFAGGIVSYLCFLHTVRKNFEPVVLEELEDLKKSMKIRRNIHVKKTKLLNAPLMTGVFRMILLIPERELGDGDLKFILMHELTHCKRHDLLYKWFAFVVNSLHWFNPLVYVAVKQINEECEISCDLSVTENMSDDDKRQYMNTIVSLAAKK